ncbi:hypothetical protein VNO77_07205 [Canavalia gladiata]|uniref:Uncharacterized protein n=1 Tax=Canavalia gladiata TaxID=3824 RepID=A0AAN9M895_CANGL
MIWFKNSALKESHDQLGSVGSHASSRSASIDQEPGQGTLRPQAEHIRASFLSVNANTCWARVLDLLLGAVMPHLKKVRREPLGKLDPRFCVRFPHVTVLASISTIWSTIHSYTNLQAWSHSGPSWGSKKTLFS